MRLKNLRLFELATLLVRFDHVALTDLRISASFRVTSSRTLRTTCVSKERKMESMNDHDSATIVITFLLLLPWLGRAAVSATEVWRARTESQTKIGRASC